MKVEIELTNILLGDKSWHQICDAFKIPQEKRYESWVAEAILERIRTYLTAYIVRRSISERENGAAFTPPPQEPLTDLTEKP